MQLFGRFLLFAALACIPWFELNARTYISLGYGMQLNSMLNSTLKSNLQKLILNQSSAPLVGISGLAAYNSNWSASPADGASPYTFVGLPEVRVATDWDVAKLGGRIGFFGSVSGFLPQTNSYYLGSLALTEAKGCPTVDYATCPLGATNFVSSSGTATYDAEVRSSLRFYNLVGGFTFTRKVASVASGDLVVGGELALNVQSLAVTTQFVGSRCTTGGSSPCNSISQSRVFQGELRTQAVYALGPVLGATVRYERPQSFWFAELGLSATLLFYKLENSGYSNFIAAGTVAFSQSSTAAGIDATQNIIAVLPAAIIRFGVHL